MNLTEHLSQEITSRNRRPAHSPYSVCEAPQDTLFMTNHKCAISLNGTYEFCLFPNVEAVPNFYTESFPGFSESIQVPGNWETQGYSTPIYTNMHHPWSLETNPDCAVDPGLNNTLSYRAPNLPKENAAGCYRRFFTLPENTAGTRYLLHFEGVESAFYLWVNGKLIGYSEDSKLPSEFDITAAVRPGRNLLAVMVTRFSTATYLEDQDYWYLSGIYRNVSLITMPKLAIEDYKVRALPNLATGAAKVLADITITKEHGYAAHTVNARLYDGSTLLSEGFAAVRAFAEYRNVELPTASTGRVELTVAKAELWTPETPKLYRLELNLLDENGTIVDTEVTRIGFKEIRVKNGVVLLNGRRLIVRGVNRHEHCPNGRTVSREHMISEIREMKRMGINSVRTCHYPDSPEWYRLCDEYGLLLICECNLETHGMMGELSHNPVYAPNYVERAARMVQTYKNHVSIYSWSLGNESGFGPNHAAMYGFIKEYDKDRLCQYEAGEPGKNISDVRGNMYAPITTIEELLASPTDDRPIILVEYLYQIRNSGGGLYRFNELLSRYPRFQGGYIWDWQDKCLLARTEDGFEYYGYGYDFNDSYGEESNPPYMTNNGIVLPDLTWKPVAYEVREAYSPIQITEPESTAWATTYPYEGRYLIHNSSMTRPLSDYRVLMQIKANGIVISESELDLPEVLPGESFELNPLEPITRNDGVCYHIDFIVSERNPSWYATEEDTLLHAQFELQGDNYKAPKSQENYSISGSSKNGLVTITVGPNRYSISTENAALVEASHNGVSCLAESALPCFSRPLSGIDCSPNWGACEEYALGGKVESKANMTVCIVGDKNAILRFDLTFTALGKPFGSATLQYLIAKDGSLTTEYRVNTLPKLLPRIGLEFLLPKGFETVTYFGRGTNENYSDRKLSAPLGVYETTVEGMHFPFNPPSENGGHEDCRYVEFSSADATIRFTGSSCFHFDARHYTTEACNAAKHEHELVHIPETILHIDAAHSQIGGDLGWSGELDPNLSIGGKEHFLCFTISM